jgi:hypothetical protein
MADDNDATNSANAATPIKYDVARPDTGGTNALEKAAEELSGGPRSRTWGGSLLEGLGRFFRRDDTIDEIMKKKKEKKIELATHILNRMTEDLKEYENSKSRTRQHEMRMLEGLEQESTNERLKRDRVNRAQTIEADRRKALEALERQLDAEDAALNRRYTRLLNDAEQRRAKALSGHPDVDAAYRDQNYFDDLIARLSNALDRERQGLADKYGESRQKINLKHDRRLASLDGDGSDV